MEPVDDMSRKDLIKLVYELVEEIENLNKSTRKTINQLREIYRPKEGHGGL